MSGDFLAQLATAAAQAAVEVAVQYAIRSLTEKKTPRAIGWSPIKQPVPPRHYAYGRGRKPGVSLFFESVPKHTLDVLAFCDGLTAGTNRTLYFHDDVVTYNPGTGVTNQGEAGRYGGPIKVSFRNGLATETAHSIITALAGGKWTSAHRADGTMTVAVDCQMVSDEKMRTIYPNGEVDTSISQDWLRVYDWRKDTTAGGSGAHRRNNPSTWEWSANPIVCWVHDEWYVNGASWARRFAPNLAALTAEANACDEAVPQAAGGTAPRYECFLWYEANEDRKTVRDNFMRSCDGWMAELGDGSYLFRVGRWVEPEVIITPAMLIDYSWVGGIPKARRVNEVQPRFRVPELLYELADTDPVVNQDSINAHGRRPVVLALEEVTNNNQAARLGKIKLADTEAQYSGEWLLDLDRTPASIFTRRFHRAQLPGGPSSLNDVYVEFLRPTIDMTARTLSVQVKSVDPDRYDFDVGEEGAGPVIEGRIPPSPPPAAGIIYAEVFRSDGSDQPRLRLVLTDILDPSATYAVRWRVDGDDDWVTDAHRSALVGVGVTVETSGVAAATLEVQVQTRTAAGTGDWEPEPPLSVDATAVVPPTTDFSAVGGVGVINLEARAPATPGFQTVKFKRGATAAYGSATTVYTDTPALYGVVMDANAAAAGSYYCWAVAVSATGQESTPEGPILASVT